MDSDQLWALTPAIICTGLVMFAFAWIAPRTTKKEEK